MPDGPVANSVLQRYRRGIIPEIQAVDVFIVQPEPRVMRVIGTFTGARYQREASCNGDAGERIDGKQDRLLD